MTPITYKEATELLNCSIGRIHTAVSQKRLAKIPSSTKEGKLIKEQVVLFKGKQIRINQLNKQEKELWDKYNLEAKNIFNSSIIEVEVVSQDNPFHPISEWISKFVEYSKENTLMHTGFC